MSDKSSILTCTNGAPMPLRPGDTASLTADASATHCSRGYASAGCEADGFGDAEPAWIRDRTCASR